MSNEVAEIAGLMFKDKKARENLEKTNQQIIKMNARKKIEWVAHRGALMEVPENTVLAWEWAQKQYFDGIECDVQATADNELIIMHDDTVDRTTNGTGNIRSLTKSQIDALIIDAGENIEKYAETYDPFTDTTNPLKIPTFEEFVMFCKKANMKPYIEIKFEDNDILIEKLINILKNHRMQHNCVISTSTTSILEKIKEIDTNIVADALLSLNATNVEYCISKNLGIIFEYWSPTINNAADLIKRMHQNHLSVGVWNWQLEEDKTPLSWGVDYVICDRVQNICNGNFYIDKMHFTNKYYLEKYLQAKPCTDFSLGIADGFVNYSFMRYSLMEYHNAYWSKHMGRAVNLTKIKIKSDSEIKIQLNPNYSLALHFYKDSGYYTDSGWITEDKLSDGKLTIAIPGNAVYMLLYAKRTDARELNHVDYENVIKMIESIKY